VLRHVAGFGIALALAGCTEQVFLDDVRDGGSPDLGVVKDASLFPASDAFCGDIYLQLHYWTRAAQLVIMLDRSSAMQTSFGGGTRESNAEQALFDAIGQYQFKIKFGFEQFPPDSTDTSSADCQRSACCAGSMEVLPNFNALPSISGLLQCSGTPSSTCPSASDDSASYAALEQIRDWNYKSKNNPSNDDRYLLLVTASEPSCSALANSKDACSRALSAASDLGNSSFRVVVLSVGYQPDSGSCLVRISQTGSSLSMPANTSTLYKPSSVYALNDNVNELFAAVAKTSCTFDWTDVPPSGAELVVSTGPNTTVPQVDSTDKDGWSFANPSHTSITFSGTWCDNYVNSQLSKISVGYYCSTCGGSNACPWP
jgi:hypothetical protein